ncbi:LLM class flavin-dependent oxidoreductase [Rhodococcus qingshengii]|uniref:LLM class flavin-dependent oxidoreductase n=1 Tax=Rhodococcus qingshengii TaxID=334542 RepID=UPI001BEA7B4D|nr:LLM class flavin-dependent oxidoreductase [Rhodococcus qingshengii]MBT2269966.1 LLM class flavin-dependent oxidoreductase [Rhodococcus qingshengii]
MIKPWLFEFFHAVHDPARRDDPVAVQEQFEKYTDLWVDDEALGWEGIFFSEHHFGPGYSPSPNLVIANLAPRTSTLRLGVLGTVTPYATPWRVAEEFAMLDHMTGGRLEMGVVSGIPPEIGIVGISKDNAAQIHAETLDVLLAAMNKPLLSHHGERFVFDSLRITPSFLRSIPAVWTAATSPASARRAGTRGLKMCSGFSSVEDLKHVMDAYQQGARDAGKSTGPDQVAIRRVVSLVEDESELEQARDTAHEGIKEFFAFSMEALKLPDAPERPTEKDEVIYGTPDQVADEIIRQCTELNVGNFLTTFNVFDIDELRRQHELFGKYVAPRLREADLD